MKNVFAIMATAVISTALLTSSVFAAEKCEVDGKMVHVTDAKECEAVKAAVAAGNLEGLSAEVRTQLEAK